VKRKTRFTLVTQKTSLVLLLRRAKWKEKKNGKFYWRRRDGGRNMKELREFRKIEN
jgi:hypothetical protein